MLAGQADESDPSHFVLTYTLNGNTGHIDGWLQNGDTVKLTVRDGLPAFRP